MLQTTSYRELFARFFRRQFRPEKRRSTSYREDFSREISPFSRDSFKWPKAKVTSHLHPFSFTGCGACMRRIPRSRPRKTWCASHEKVGKAPRIVPGKWGQHIFFIDKETFLFCVSRQEGVCTWVFTYTEVSSKKTLHEGYMWRLQGYQRIQLHSQNGTLSGCRCTKV